MIGSYWYHKSIKKTIAVFGSLFSDITIKAGTGELVKVPIHFGQKSKWIEALFNNEDVGSMFTDTTIPSIGFEITSYLYNSESMTNPLNIQHQRLQQSGEEIDFMFSSIPYTIGIELYVATNTLDEGYQILEQIVPFFTPQLTVSINDIDLYNLKTNLTFDLTAISQDIQNDGSFDEKSIKVWNFSFLAHTKFHSNPRAIQKIKDVIINMSEKDHEDAFDKLVGHREPGEKDFKWNNDK